MTDFAAHPSRVAGLQNELQHVQDALNEGHRFSVWANTTRRARRDRLEAELYGRGPDGSTDWKEVQPGMWECFLTTARTPYLLRGTWSEVTEAARKIMTVGLL